jgi:hypothetical protein
VSDADRETVRRMWQEVAGSLPDQNAWEAAIERWWHPAGQLEYLRAYWDPDEALADARVSSP